jgi:hypothetical protein
LGSGGRYENSTVFVVPARQTPLAGGIDSLESIPGQLGGLWSAQRSGRGGGGVRGGVSPSLISTMQYRT